MSTDNPDKARELDMVERGIKAESLRLLVIDVAVAHLSVVSGTGGLAEKVATGS